MSWEAISNFSQVLDDTIQNSIERKRARDAASEIPNTWADFISSAANLDNAQNNLDVRTDDKGSLNCLMSFPENHPDYKDNNKIFSNFVLDKFDALAKSTISNAKNPITRDYLIKHTGQYKAHLAENLVKVEARLIHDKRYNDSVVAVEKTARSVYIKPSEFENSLNTVLNSINVLSIPPQDKEKLSHIAKEQIAYHAALSTLHSNPSSVLGDSPWKEYLSVPKVLKLENQARNIINVRQSVIESNIKSTFKSHIDSILNTGSGIIGFDDLAKNSVNYQSMKQEESVAHLKYQGLQDIKYLPFDQAISLLSSNTHVDDPIKHAIHESLKNELDKQIKSANDDPAKFVEKTFSDELDAINGFESRLQFRKNLQIAKGITPKYLTKDERHLILNKINSDDVGVVTSEVDKVLNLGKGDNNIGLEILNEVLSEDNHLKIPVLFYAKRKMLNQDINEFAAMIPRHKELFSMQSGQEKTQLTKAINANSDLKYWKKKMILHQPHNMKNVEETYEGVRHLARFYQMERSLDENASVEKAVKKLVTDNYTTDMGFFSSNIFNSSLSTLILPKQMVRDGKVETINADIIKKKLVEIKSAIMYGQITFDIDDTFGTAPNEYTKSIRDETIKNLLKKAKFFLTEDGAKINLYFFDGTNYRAIMKDGREMSFDLIDLNE